MKIRVDEMKLETFVCFERRSTSARCAVELHDTLCSDLLHDLSDLICDQIRIVASDIPSDSISEDAAVLLVHRKPSMYVDSSSSARIIRHKDGLDD